MSTEKIQVISLPYFEDSSQLFAPIAEQPWAVFLDSGYPYSHQGRYDIISADPDITLITRGEVSEINERGQLRLSDEDPFELIKGFLADRADMSDLPFNGGAIGYFSYDLARRLEKLPVNARNEENIAELMIGIYPWAVIVDHLTHTTVLVAQVNGELDIKQLEDQFSVLRPAPEAEKFSLYADPVSNMSEAEYADAFNKIINYLREGDSYQVNLSQRFQSNCSGHPWPVYQALRKQNPAPFSAFLNYSDLQVLSSSPERFIRQVGGAVETKPIKGTRPRLNSAKHDAKQVKLLQGSEKDRAENLMIVDLLRNDISKNCQDGSVSVPKLFDVETFATVHHLVSTVTGTLSQGQHALDLLKSCFPGGSITGAPKIRSMEIIEELEPHRRGIYCGALGYIGFNGNMDTNIAIRTLVHSDHRIRFWAGGGIVNDSVMESEYQESFDKAAALFKVLKPFKK